MDPSVSLPLRVATQADAATVAALLHDFNTEYGTPSPGPAVLKSRLERLLASQHVIALLGGLPPVGVALITLRASVWFDGPVAVLEEFYVTPARRGRGLGSRMLAAAEGEVLGRGGKLLEINVDGDDTAARRFYERHGYANHEPGEQEPLLYYYRELDSREHPVAPGTLGA